MSVMRRLLVVDDERIDRAIAVRWAQRMGYEVRSADSLQAADALLKAGEQFDFVLLDLILGRDDGLELLPALAAMDNDPLVVFASGFDERVLASSQRLAAQLGLRVAGYARKPFDPSALRAILDNVPPRFRTGGGAVSVTPGAVRDAISAGDIQPWFQPKTSLSSGAITGAEALARWTGPDGRAIAPGDFIGVAESGGLAAALTDAILDQSLAACALWRRSQSNCTVAVNVSPQLLDDPDLTRRVERMLLKHGIPPGALVLEITEGTAIPDTARATEILTRLRIWGINLAVDDFGTGHSSLLALARMPFNELKIDQAFVTGASTHGESLKIVTAIASMGRGLGLKVIAEGIETSCVANAVRDAGCDTGQGWLYGRATPAAAFAALLAPQHACGSGLPE